VLARDILAVCACGVRAQCPCGVCVRVCVHVCVRWWWWVCTRLCCARPDVPTSKQYVDNVFNDNKRQATTSTAIVPQESNKENKETCKTHQGTLQRSDTEEQQRATQKNTSERHPARSRDVHAVQLIRILLLRSFIPCASPTTAFDSKRLAVGVRHLTIHGGGGTRVSVFGTSVALGCPTYRLQERVCLRAFPHFREVRGRVAVLFGSNMND